MSLAFTVTKSLGVAKGRGGTRTHIVRVTFDNAYPDGGYAITAANLGFDSAVYSVVPMGLIHDADTTAAETAYYPSYDQVLGKLQAFTSGAGAANDPPGEATNSLAGLNGLVCDFLTTGI